MEFALTIAVALAAGAISAIFGVGGGFLLVPFLSGLLEVPMHLAVGSVACYMLGPSTTSLLFRRLSAENLRLPLILSGGLLIGVVLGATTLDAFARSADERSADVLVLGIYCVMLSLLGGFSLWESIRASLSRPIRRGWISTWLVPPVVSLVEWQERRMSLTVLGWFAVGVGFVSGLVGISGGLLVLPGLIYLFGLPAQESVVCSLVVVWLVSFESTIAHAWHDNVHLPLVVALLAGGTIGARLGTTIGRRLHSQQIRQNFGLLALGTALFVGIRLLTLLW